jgi:hypothetical protein
VRRHGGGRKASAALSVDYQRAAVDDNEAGDPFALPFAAQAPDRLASWRNGRGYTECNVPTVVLVDRASASHRQYRIADAVLWMSIADLNHQAGSRFLIRMEPWQLSNSATPRALSLRRHPARFMPSRSFCN